VLPLPHLALIAPFWDLGRYFEIDNRKWVSRPSPSELTKPIPVTQTSDFSVLNMSLCR